jgi:hypothetical protein
VNFGRRMRWQRISYVETKRLFRNHEPLHSSLPNVGSGVLASYWTPDRQKIRDLLAQESPSLAELYEGAVRILFELRPPGYCRFVAHAVREIGNGLEFIIFGIRSRERLDYKDRLDRIVSQWKRAGFAINRTLAGLEPIVNSDGPRPKEFLGSSRLTRVWKRPMT